MTDTDLLDRPAPELDAERRLQYRTSPDGISSWTPWRELRGPDSRGIYTGRWDWFVQVRCWRDGRWHVSPIAYWSEAHA